MLELLQGKSGKKQIGMVSIVVGDKVEVMAGSAGQDSVKIPLPQAPSCKAQGFHGDNSGCSGGSGSSSKTIKES